jgi:PREDICTED: bardet-biedl syndrome 7 protein-like
MNIKLNRVDYLQVGLTFKNTLKLVNLKSSDKITLSAVIGDHNGSVQCFNIKSESVNVETLFKTSPNANSKVTSLQVVLNDTGSPKIIVAFAPSSIKGFNLKGKFFFHLDLNNLTESIEHLQVKWPSNIFIGGQYIYNHYMVNLENLGGGREIVVQCKNFYVSPCKITGLIVIQDHFNQTSGTLIYLHLDVFVSFCSFSLHCLVKFQYFLVKID